MPASEDRSAVSGEITRCLQDWRGGEEDALARLTAAVYRELRRLASSLSFPIGGLVQSTNGTFYGTTYQGGADNDGTVFTLSEGLGPFVETVPTSGRVGSAVKILGTHLSAASSVTFNGTAAVFHVVGPSEIAATVPAGATTGNVQVATPGGLLVSNAAFQVR